MDDDKKDSDDELSIDQNTEIKEETEKPDKNQEKIEESEEESSSKDELSFDFNKIINFFKKNKYIIPILLILIAMSFSVYFRSYPADLPITDTWAKDTVYNFYRNEIRNQVNKEYPNLPESNKNNLVEGQFQEVLKTEKDTVEEQIQQLSQEYKNNFKDSDGQTYLLAIDPYVWYGEVRNYIRNGHFGTDIVDGKEMNMLRNGRVGKGGARSFHPLFSAYFYKFISIFSDASLMSVFFYMPLIIVTLSIIPAFFIGKRVGGNVGGFFAGMIVAINAALLSRTPAGFADTDAYNVFFPLMITWLFLEAFETTDKKKDIIYAGLGGLLAGLYAFAWTGWWYVFDFILASVGIYLAYYILVHIDNIKKGLPVIKEILFTTGIFFISSSVFVSLFTKFQTFLMFLKGPFSVIAMKEVAVRTLWPNVLTTVAEFNEVALGAIIGQMGGALLFLLAIAGIVLTILKTDRYGRRDIKYVILLIIWFIGTLYGFTKGMRFAILMIPAFSIAFGVAVGVIYEYLSKWIIKEMNIDKYITKTVLIIILLLLLVGPLKAAANVAKNEIPSMNDAWYDSLIGIKNDADDAIITSWWDFGHWFVAIAERRVTFDGGDQGRKIHWVGKSLLTDDEDVSVGILRMLNCGQILASDTIINATDNDTVRGIDIQNKIIVEDKNGAKKILEKEGFSNDEIEQILKYTHCDDLIPQYYITSEDMVGKAGVWGHFGSWDFERALMWQTVRKLDMTEGTRVLREEFGLSEEEADNYYYEIQNNKADQWVSPWPGYLSGVSSCTENDGIIKCGNGIEVDSTSMKAVVSTQQGKVPVRSIAFINKNREFEIKENNGAAAVVSAALIPTGNGLNSILMHPRLAGSMFTRLFFFDGQGLRHFEIFSDKRQVTGGRIQVWKVNWEEGEPINLMKNE
ncbi:dolichyl-diphosphooligosaccharide--protein glycosyltransferase subunit STT3 [Candidatus Woesearchaeota archaeon]|nr:dolichyl-diphosphooligosaccharide--protein glycosyltransferase subunit STT3 [Candidatus Woesearchaeota archaeon]